MTEIGTVVISLWFSHTNSPRTVLESRPPADRGFARKFLSQLNPAWKLSSLGVFDMNRSTPPGNSEFYVGGYPGLAVVQFRLPELRKISDIPVRYRDIIPAHDIYAHCRILNTQDGIDDSSPSSGFAAFAHWKEGKLVRAFSATHNYIYEDHGLPEVSETPFWDKAAQSRGVGMELGFPPHELANAVLDDWLGFSPSQGDLPIPIAAFATDGRPELKESHYPLSSPLSSVILSPDRAEPQKEDSSPNQSRGSSSLIRTFLDPVSTKLSAVLRRIKS